MAKISPPPGFDLPLAQEASRLVQDAYAQFKQGSGWHIQPGYDLLASCHARPEGVFAKDEPFGFVARNHETGDVFVTFRGTESLEDWLSNLTFPQVPHPAPGWGEVEKGFMRIYAQCSATVIQAVKDSGAQRLVVTGHSLGGALATLAAADLAVNLQNPSLYSFASPRTGDPDFAKKFNQEVKVNWRVANTEDIVTTVPLATLVLESGKARVLPIFLAMASHLGHALDFEHVGIAVAFTTHNGSVLGNHGMQTYIDAMS